jgi:hypothetical protein
MFVFQMIRSVTRFTAQPTSPGTLTGRREALQAVSRRRCGARRRLRATRIRPASMPGPATSSQIPVISVLFAPKRLAPTGGTESSNPASSSGESAANRLPGSWLAQTRPDSRFNHTLPQRGNQARLRYVTDPWDEYTRAFARLPGLGAICLAQTGQKGDRGLKSSGNLANAGANTALWP